MKNSHYLILLFLVVFSTSLCAQRYKPGRYHDVFGNTVEGFIYFEIGDSPVLKFKKTRQHQFIEVSTATLNGFVILKDSFTVVRDFSIEWNTGDMYKMNESIVQVIESGEMTLYKYTAVQGNLNYSHYASFPYHLDGYLIKPADSNRLITPRKYNDDRLKQQLIALFSKDQELVTEIVKVEHPFSSIPQWIRKFNAKN